MSDELRLMHDDSCARADQSSPRSVSIVVACRNERHSIESLLHSIMGQDFDGLQWEAIIADGESTDGTDAVVQSYSAREARIRFIRNSGRIVSTGLNAAIREARGSVILRLDAHTSYAPDYCRRCVETLDRTGADNVGGPARTLAAGRWGSAIAAAYHSPFSTGGGRFHRENYEGWVDTVPYGCWRTDVFSRIGLFDEHLVRNQDDELNLRLRRSGGSIWQSRSIRSWYVPRSSLRKLFHQYFQYGFWKVAVIRKHRIPASWRHLVPAAFVAANIFLPLLWALGVVLAGCFWLYMLAAYCILNAAASCVTAHEHEWLILPELPIVYFIYHLSYGTGFLAGLLLMRSAPGETSSASPLFTAVSR